MVEQRTENPCVGGPIPPLATMFFLICFCFSPKNTKDFSVCADLRIRIDEVIKVLQRDIMSINLHDTTGINSTSQADLNGISQSSGHKIEQKVEDATGISKKYATLSLSHYSFKGFMHRVFHKFDKMETRDLMIYANRHGVAKLGSEAKERVENYFEEIKNDAEFREIVSQFNGSNLPFKVLERYMSLVKNMKDGDFFVFCRTHESKNFPKDLAQEYLHKTKSYETMPLKDFGAKLAEEIGTWSNLPEVVQKEQLRQIGRANTREFLEFSKLFRNKHIGVHESIAERYNRLEEKYASAKTDKDFLKMLKEDNTCEVSLLPKHAAKRLNQLENIYAGAIGSQFVAFVERNTPEYLPPKAREKYLDLIKDYKSVAGTDKQFLEFIKENGVSNIFQDSAKISKKLEAFYANMKAEQLGKSVLLLGDFGKLPEATQAMIQKKCNSSRQFLCEFADSFLLYNSSLLPDFAKEALNKVGASDVRKLNDLETVVVSANLRKNGAFNPKDPLQSALLVKIRDIYEVVVEKYLEEVDPVKKGDLRVSLRKIYNAMDDQLFAVTLMTYKDDEDLRSIMQEREFQYRNTAIPAALQAAREDYQKTQTSENATM